MFRAGEDNAYDKFVRLIKKLNKAVFNKMWRYGMLISLLIIWDLCCSGIILLRVLYLSFSGVVRNGRGMILFV